MMRCSGCGEKFRAIRVFDAHRTGAFSNSRKKTKDTRRCLTVREMKRIGLVLGSKGIWSRPSEDTTFSRQAA